MAPQECPICKQDVFMTAYEMLVSSEEVWKTHQLRHIREDIKAIMNTFRIDDKITVELLRGRLEDLTNPEMALVVDAFRRLRLIVREDL